MPADGPGIPEFDRRFFDGQAVCSRIGGGSIGGKAAGLVAVQQGVLAGLGPEEFAGFSVSVPCLAVLACDVFDRFMERNDLRALAESDEPDDRIAHAFQRADLPAEVVGDLRALITGVHTPLAVRSSSMLEDALDHPFAGVYATKMIPNNQADIDTRFRKLIEAVKFVYASTFFRAAKAYLRSAGLAIGSEKMAVILQEVVGQRHGDRYYPTLSGVARSFNYYPSGRSRPEQGVINLALGLGKTIVDGGLSWTYSPAQPKAPPPFGSNADRLKQTQTRFWAVHMGQPPPPDPIRETEFLVEAELAMAEADGELGNLVSTYDPQSDRFYPGLAPSGPRVLDFAPLLGTRRIPLNDLLKRLLQLGEAAAGGPVEVEFAADLDPRAGLPARLGFLQMRPMRVCEALVEVDATALADPAALVVAERAMGNGVVEGLNDVVYLRPGAFDAAHSRQMARELEEVNARLLAAGRPYLLMGFGRWGSSDPWLGVPVEWGQICGARVIVEATLPRMNPDPSQGSHFFHNLIGLQILYLTVPCDGPGRIDWDWLEAQPAESETDFVRQVHSRVPLQVRVDGRSGRGVVRRDERSE